MVLLFSNFSVKDGSSYFSFTLDGKKPVLPEIPYDYESISFPVFLFNPLITFSNTPYPQDLSGVTGPSSGFGSPEVFNSITNDLATLGRVLFYDDKLSATGDISCASCHDQANSFAQNIPRSEGTTILTARNSMHLNDLAWTSNGRFSWDMGVESLHRMISLPLADANEIGAEVFDLRERLENTQYYPELFEKAFGDDRIDDSRVIHALAQFIKSMTTLNSKFDRGLETGFEDFTASENAGMDLFVTNCATCHTTNGANQIDLFLASEDPDGDIFTGIFGPEILSRFNNGLASDLEDQGAGAWDIRFANLFKIQTLRNIELTGPYMHDGSIETLEEVIDHYSEGVKSNEWHNDESIIKSLPTTGFGFTATEKVQLVDFLKTFTDRTITTDVRWSDPFRDSSTSTEENAITGLLLRPNPMTDRAMLQFDNPSGEAMLIEVISPSGQLLKSEVTTESSYELRKNDFSKGIYLLQLTMGDKKSTERLVVQ